jgi:AAA+ ATPase superfamily predicted ATPase
MDKKKFEYKQEVAFINREIELKDLRTFIDKEPSEIIFLHGPKSSGKTTLLYRFFKQIQEEEQLNLKFINLREHFISGYSDFLKIFFKVEEKGEKTGKLTSDLNIGFFKISAEIENKMLAKRVDPFKVMKKEFLALTGEKIKPVLIIDELQALDKIYLNNGRDRQLIIELFNFFVAMTKESHLAHVIIASSDGYFINQVYTDSRLKKTSTFYKVDYLNKEDVMEWLLNLEKYSKIKDYTLTEADAEKIWDTVGGSMWEIQDILTGLFKNPIDDVLYLCKKKIKGIISHYIGVNHKKEKVLNIFCHQEAASIKDFLAAGIPEEEVDGLANDLVRNNILYFDPTEALYYPQGKSFQWGIKLYFESII